MFVSVYIWLPLPRIFFLPIVIWVVVESSACEKCLSRVRGPTLFERSFPRSRTSNLISRFANKIYFLFHLTSILHRTNSVECSSQIGDQSCTRDTFNDLLSTRSMSSLHSNHKFHSIILFLSLHLISSYFSSSCKVLLIKLRKIYKFFKNCSSRQYKKISSFHAASVS